MGTTDGFLMDYSLYRVAKYLRLLGYNAVCDSTLHQNELLKKSITENLALITSSSILIARVMAHNMAVKKRRVFLNSRRTVVAYDSDGESIYSEEDSMEKEIVLYEIRQLNSENFLSVMVDLIQRARLSYNFVRVFSRCVACNEVLQSVPKDSVKNDVHAKVYEIYDAFTRCPKCRKVFWGVDGTDIANYATLRTLEALQRLCRAAGVLECKNGSCASLRYFRSFPRAVHSRIVSFLPLDDLRSLTAVFPQLIDLRVAIRERIKSQE